MNITINEETIQILESKFKEYINGKKALSFIWQFQNDNLRNPRKYGEEEFIAKCLLEATEGRERNNSFIEGCMAAHSVLESEFYEVKNEYNVEDE